MSGIEMPSMKMFDLRATMKNELAKLVGDVRILLVGCEKAADVGRLRSTTVAALSLPCTAMLPPSFIEFVLHEQLVDGVMITGCREYDCYHRLGVLWTQQRLNAKREPRLRSRAERERIKSYWAAAPDIKNLKSELESFRTTLAGSRQKLQLREGLK